MFFKLLSITALTLNQVQKIVEPKGVYVTQHRGLTHFTRCTCYLKLFCHHRVQSAQQFQALQAQYSGFNSNHQLHYPEGQAGETAMANPEPMMDQQEPANLAKRTMMPFE